MAIDLPCRYLAIAWTIVAPHPSRPTGPRLGNEQASVGDGGGTISPIGAAVAGSEPRAATARYDHGRLGRRAPARRRRASVCAFPRAGTSLSTAAAGSVPSKEM